MVYVCLLPCLGASLVIMGMAWGYWGLAAIWLGVNFLLLGTAHAMGATGILGKCRHGTLPVWSWIVFLPLHSLTYGIWHLTRLVSREPSTSALNECIVLGRRHLGSELRGQFTNIVDLTSEFSEPREIREQPGYVSFPILDGGVPSLREVEETIARLQKGKTFIHCAQGHGRTGLFCMALLLQWGKIRGLDEGYRLLKTVRPGIRLNAAQRAFAERFAHHVKSGVQESQTRG